MSREFKYSSEYVNSSSVDAESMLRNSYSSPGSRYKRSLLNWCALRRAELAVDGDWILFASPFVVIPRLVDMESLL
jgi:hypothetical protein